MRLGLFAVVAVAVVWPASGQRAYTAQQIRVAADSVLRSSVGKRVFQSATCAVKPYYLTRNGDEEAYDYVPDTGFTAGDFLRAVVRYHFDLPWPECPMYDRIMGVTEVALDSNLRPLGLPVLDSLPDFVLLNEPCGLLSKAEAIALAEQRNFYVVGMHATLRFQRHPKRFVWHLEEAQNGPVDTSFLAAARAGKPFVLPFKGMRLDARTGEPIRNTDTIRPGALQEPQRW